MPVGSNYNVDKLKQIFTYCANAVREKTGETAVMTPDEMADKISQLQTINVLDPLDQIISRDANNMIISARFGNSIEVLPDIFKNQYKLENIVLSESMTELIDQQFLNCSRLSVLYVPDNFTTFGSEILKGCTGISYLNIKTLPIQHQSGSLTIYTLLAKFFNTNATTNNGQLPSALKEVRIRNMPTIGISLIDNARTVEKLYLDGTHYFANNSLAYCSALTELTCVELKNESQQGTTLSNICGTATLNSLTKLTLTGDTPFDNEVLQILINSKLTELNLPNAQFIPNTIAMPTTLTSVSMPKIRSIGNSAFTNTKLTEVVIPVTCQTIGDYAFSNCTTLIDFRYNGSTSGWYNINFGSHWHDDSAFTVVHCSDGDITL